MFYSTLCQCKTAVDMIYKGLTITYSQIVSSEEGNLIRYFFCMFNRKGLNIGQWVLHFTNIQHFIKFPTESGQTKIWTDYVLFLTWEKPY